MSTAPVHVCLEDGQPCLQIIDADTASVRLAWRAPAEGEDLDRLGLRDFCRECLLMQAAAAWWQDDEPARVADGRRLSPLARRTSGAVAAAARGGGRAVRRRRRG